MRLYAWWSGMARQGRTGWPLVIFGVGYLLWFFKARLTETGPPCTGEVARGGGAAGGPTGARGRRTSVTIGG